MKQFERINKKVETKIYGRITNYYAEAVVYKGPVYYSEHGGVKQRSDEG